MMKTLRALAVVALGLAFSSASAGAALLTMDFDSPPGTLQNNTGPHATDYWLENGLRLSDPAIDNSNNCPDPACTKLNSAAVTSSTLDADPATNQSTFDIRYFWLRFSGEGGSMDITPTPGVLITLTEAIYDKAAAHLYDFGSVLTLSSLLFSNTSVGNGVVRIDCINELTCGGPTSVPVPAALPLFLAGLGGLAWLGRRRARRI